MEGTHCLATTTRASKDVADLQSRHSEIHFFRILDCISVSRCSFFLPKRLVDLPKSTQRIPFLRLSTASLYLFDSRLHLPVSCSRRYTGSDTPERLLESLSCISLACSRLFRQKISALGPHILSTIPETNSFLYRSFSMFCITGVSVESPAYSQGLYPLTHCSLFLPVVFYSLFSVSIGGVGLARIRCIPPRMYTPTDCCAFCAVCEFVCLSNLVRLLRVL
jgi:hypothetical protein